MERKCVTISVLLLWLIAVLVNKGSMRRTDRGRGSTGSLTKKGQAGRQGRQTDGTDRRPDGEEEKPAVVCGSGALRREVVGCMVSHNKQHGDNCTTF